MNLEDYKKLSREALIELLIEQKNINDKLINSTIEKQRNDKREIMELEQKIELYEKRETELIGIIGKLKDEIKYLKGEIKK